MAMAAAAEALDPVRRSKRKQGDCLQKLWPSHSDETLVVRSVTWFNLAFPQFFTSDVVLVTNNDLFSNATFSLNEVTFQNTISKLTQLI